VKIAGGVGLNPFPAFGADFAGDLVEPGMGQLIDEGQVGEVGMPRVEKIGHHVPAGCLIGVEADEDGARIGRPDEILRDALAKAMGLAVVSGGVEPGAFLNGMVLAEGEGLGLFEAHPVCFEFAKDAGAEPGELEALAHDQLGGCQSAPNLDPLSASNNDPFSGLSR